LPLDQKKKQNKAARQDSPPRTRTRALLSPPTTLTCPPDLPRSNMPRFFHSEECTAPKTDRADHTQNCHRQSPPLSIPPPRTPQHVAARGRAPTPRDATTPPDTFKNGTTHTSTHVRTAHHAAPPRSFSTQTNRGGAAAACIQE
jgi:hypothetical protein